MLENKTPALIVAKKWMSTLCLGPRPGERIKYDLGSTLRCPPAYDCLEPCHYARVRFSVYEVETHGVLGNFAWPSDIQFLGKMTWLYAFSI